MHLNRKGFLLALLSALGFSSLGLFAKLIYAQGFSVPQSLAWRFSLAAFLLWIVVFATKRHRYSRFVYLRLVLLAVFGFAPQAGLYFLTVRYLDPGLASLLLYLYPAFVIVIMLLVFRQKPSSRQLAALVLALAGCVLTLWTSSAYPLPGIVFGVLVAISYAAYLAASEKLLKGVDPVFATALIMAIAALVYWLITLAGGTVQVPTSVLSLVGIFGIAVISTILPIVTLFSAIGLVGTANASLVSTAEPLFTIFMSALIIGERLTPTQFAGAFCIITALLVLNARRRGTGPASANG